MGRCRIHKRNAYYRPARSFEDQDVVRRYLVEGCDAVLREAGLDGLGSIQDPLKVRLAENGKVDTNCRVELMPLWRFKLDADVGNESAENDLLHHLTPGIGATSYPGIGGHTTDGLGRWLHAVSRTMSSIFFMRVPPGSCSASRYLIPVCEEVEAKRSRDCPTSHKSRSCSFRSGRLIVDNES